MTNDPTVPSGGATLDLSQAAWHEWNRNVESVLRGVAHMLNNRAAALAAVIELAQDADGPEVTTPILRTELQKVRELTAVIRTMGSPRTGVEAFSPRDAASEALAVLGVHGDQRERAALIEAATGAAVRVPRWMFVRALIALVASVPVAGPATHSVKVTVTDDGDWVVARVSGVSGHVAEHSPFTAELAVAMGGEPLADAYGFRLPSLAALRRREGR